MKEDFIDNFGRILNFFGNYYFKYKISIAYFESTYVKWYLAINYPMAVKLIWLYLFWNIVLVSLRSCESVTEYYIKSTFFFRFLCVFLCCYCFCNFKNVHSIVKNLTSSLGLWKFIHLANVKNLPSRVLFYRFTHELILKKKIC